MNDPLTSKSWCITSPLWAKACYKFGVKYSSSLDEITWAKVDEEYRRLICELPTEDLEIILQAHDLLKQRRANRTIESIVTELVHRELLQEEHVSR